MTDKKLRSEGYEFDGPHMVRNHRGGLNDAYKVRRLVDGAELSLAFSSTTFRDRNLQVCKAIPSDGWLPAEYSGCTFMAVNETSEDLETAEKLVGSPRLWSTLWLRDGVPPMKFFPGQFPGGLRLGGGSRLEVDDRAGRGRRPPPRAQPARPRREGHRRVAVGVG